MNKFSIKYKLIVLVIIPTIFLLFFCIFFTKEKYNNFNQLKETENIIYFTKKINLLLCSLDDELSFSLNFLIDSNNKNRVKLIRIRNKNNKLMKDFFIGSARVILNKKDKEKISQISDSFFALRKNRTKLDYKSLDHSSAITIFSKLNTSLLDLITLLTYKINNNVIQNNFISYEQLLRANALSEDEKALGIYVIKKNLHKKTSKRLFNSLIYTQRVYIQNFYRYSDLEFNVMLKNFEKDDKFLELRKIENSILFNKEELLNSFFYEKYNNWIDLNSYKINILKNLSSHILNKLEKETISLKNEAFNKMFYFLVFILICIFLFLLLERLITKDIYKSFESLFINIDELLSYINKETKEINLITHGINFNKKINSKIDILNNKFSSSKNLLKKDKKLLKNALSNSELYRNALDRSNIILRINLDKEIVYANSLFYDLSGYSKDDLLLKPYSCLQIPNTITQSINKIFDIVEKKGVWKGKLKNIAKDNSVFYTICTTIPLRNKEGKIFEYMEVRQDITKLIMMHKEIEDRQREIIYKMGEIAETRSKETGFHVRRVAQYSKDLALLYGMSEKEAEILFTASPMHDIGKVGIPDEILKKPGKLTSNEFEIMKTHAELGFNILKGSNEPILKAASIVSLEHHEKYDGSGYPKGLKGNNIHIYGRITAIADVFDALGSKRVYKDAWKDEDIFSLFLDQKSKHFDPELIDIFMSNINIFLTTRNKYVD